MLVSLPNGKVVSLSIEQYLSLEDSDIQYLVAQGCGSIASSPWCSSALKKPGRVRVKDEDDDPELTEGLSEEELELDEDDQFDPLISDTDSELEIREPEE